MAEPKRLAPKEPGVFSKWKETCKEKWKHVRLPSIRVPKPQVSSEPKTQTRRRRVSGSPLRSAVSLPLMLLYHEVLLRLFDGDSNFFDLGLLRILLFSLAAGLAVFLVLDLIPNRKVSRILGGVLVAGWTVFTCVEYCCKSFFKIYFGLGYRAGLL